MAPQTAPEPQNDAAATPDDPAGADARAGSGAVDLDVLIVGAGLSGIGAACRLRTEAPSASFAILESRQASGGTWDLFRYPGVRSDSDMFTLGYDFRPWVGSTALASGPEILEYVRDTAAEHGVDSRIEYGRRVTSASWSGADARWTVTVADAETGEEQKRTCRFLYLCTGYYRYDEGYTPEWPGVDDYTGALVHPQHWPEDLEVSGKKIVVIGSGATAVTLVPALAGLGARVTMLQRSPSYVMSLPAVDVVANLLNRLLPRRQAYAAARWKNIKLGTAMYRFCQKYPDRARALLQRGVARRLPAGYDVATHFTPEYEPWDQRLCLVPDADLFKAIGAGGAQVVTDRIETFTPKGLRLASGTDIEADVIVTATGLNLLPLGGIEVDIDGEPVKVPEHVVYKGLMLDGVPNLVFALGYTNASWTLKVDLVSEFFARLFNTMAREGRTVAVPRLPSAPMATTPFIEMSSGYFERSRRLLPLQGDAAPWRLRQHYAKDADMLRGPVDDGALVLS